MIWVTSFNKPLMAGTSSKLLPIYLFGVGDANVWLIKTDGDGDEIWKWIFGGPIQYHGYSIQQTTDGGYIIVGYTGSLDVGELNYDIWLIKTDNQGKSKTTSLGNLWFESLF